MRFTARALCLVLTILSSNVFAQGRRSTGKTLPVVGSKLPDIQAFDEQGQVLSLASLRGSYTVLVFGCLT